MKQQGKVWTDPDGDQVPVKYLSEDDKLKEKITQSICARALKLHNELMALKKHVQDEFDKLANEISADKKSHTIYSFDKSVKVVMDRTYKYDDPNFRVYLKNLSEFEDYDPIILDFNTLPNKICNEAENTDIYESEKKVQESEGTKEIEEKPEQEEVDDVPGEEVYPPQNDGEIDVHPQDGSGTMSGRKK